MFGVVRERFQGARLKQMDINKRHTSLLSLCLMIRTTPLCLCLLVILSLIASAVLWKSSKYTHTLGSELPYILSPSYSKKKKKKSLVYQSSWVNITE